MLAALGLAGDASPSNPLPSLGEVVEQIGFGPTHARYCLTGGGIYVADGAELLLISAITESLASDWGLSPGLRAFLVTIVYFGMLLGNMAGGTFGDRYGRRGVIVTSYALVFFFCILSSFAQDYVSMCILRLAVGFGIGLGIPAWNALAAELTPRRWRMVMQSASYILFTAGELYTASLIVYDDPTMEYLHWRELIRYGALPGLVCLFTSLIFMYESPSYLAVQDRKDEAENVLKVNARDNGYPDMNVEFKPAAAEGPMERALLASHISTLFGRHLLSTTLVCVFTTFMCNVMYYGFIYAIAQVLPDLQDDGTSAGVQLLIGALWELPGAVLGMIMGLYIRRKLALKISLAFCAGSLFLFVLGVGFKDSWLGEASWHIGYYGMKCFVQVVFSASYVFSSEVYPTSVRTTGAAICVAGGKLGAMVAPLVFEFMNEVLGSEFVYFWVMLVLTIFNALIIDFAPVEPTTQGMVDTLEEFDNLILSIQKQDYGLSINAP
mmetsp:Transcript_118078/g.220724  ORF Transcript_118078/g.220724 Transcript_118078/m.220724 type:complete len:495 (+) Transcript_118078:87-1571(+)